MIATLAFGIVILLFIIYMQKITIQSLAHENYNLHESIKHLRKLEESSYNSLVKAQQQLAVHEKDTPKIKDNDNIF